MVLVTSAVRQHATWMQATLPSAGSAASEGMQNCRLRDRSESGHDADCPSSRNPRLLRLGGSPPRLLKLTAREAISASIAVLIMAAAGQLHYPTPDSALLGIWKTGGRIKAVGQWKGPGERVFDCWRH